MKKESLGTPRPKRTKRTDRGADSTSAEVSELAWEADSSTTQRGYLSGGTSVRSRHLSPLLTIQAWLLPVSPVQWGVVGTTTGQPLQRCKAGPRADT